MCLWLLNMFKKGLDEKIDSIGELEAFDMPRVKISK